MSVSERRNGGAYLLSDDGGGEGHVPKTKGGKVEDDACGIIDWNVVVIWYTPKTYSKWVKKIKEMVQ